MVHVKEKSRRWMYRGRRPNPFAAFVNRGTAAVVAAGIGPKRMARLEVRGRRSGRVRSFPVVVADYEGQRYLVAMLGAEANWVRNVRAAAGEAVLRHGRCERVCLEEVEPAARGPILQRYVQVAPGARAHIPVDRQASLERFEQVAGQYPVFRISPRVSRSYEEDQQ
jgi:deazaflavin-dependent oxidoreductase (nitroreductase family)